MASVFVTIGAALLIVAGVAKVLTPEPASDALGVVGLPSHPLLVRAGSAIEVVVGVVALVVSRPIGPLLLAVSYVVFALFIVVLRREPDAGSCGCFGADGEVPSLRHVVVDLLVAAGCLWAASTHSPSTLELLRADIPMGLAYIVVCLTGAWLGGLVLGAMPAGADA